MLPNMHIICSILLIMSVSAIADAADVTLAWDQHPNPALTHYTLYQADKLEATTGPWKKVQEIEKTLTAVTITVDDGKGFAWYLTATNTAGTESGPSNVVDLYKPARIERPTCLGIPIPKR